MSTAKMYGCFKPVKRDCTPRRWGRCLEGIKENRKEKGNERIQRIQPRLDLQG